MNYKEEKLEILKALDILETLEEGWNGFDAPALCPEAIKSSRIFTELLYKNMYRMPTYISMNCEDVTFVWKAVPDHDLRVGIGGNHMYASFEEYGNMTRYVDDINFKRQARIPKRVDEFLTKVASYEFDTSKYIDMSNG